MPRRVHVVCFHRYEENRERIILEEDGREARRSCYSQPYHQENSGRISRIIYLEVRVTFLY